MSVDNHSHCHEHGDTYYLDQICMTGISATFGSICLALYYSHAVSTDGTSMLSLLLGKQFHQFVLGSGIALVLIAGLRAIWLWRQSRRPACVHGHKGHAHASDHAHDHDHAIDHDHGWAPWRYVLLLIPILLFLLGVPNKGPTATAAYVQVDPTHQLAEYAGLVAGAQPTQGDLLCWLAGVYMMEEAGQELPFKDVKFGADSARFREDMQGRTVRVRGMFVRSQNSAQVFELLRYDRKCCGADAIPVPLRMVTRDSLLARRDLRNNDWVKVTGVVDFHRFDEKHETVLRVLGLARIERCRAENPYLD